MIEEKVIGSVSPTEQALNWRWQFPRDTPPEVRRRLLAEERRAAIVERWPTLPQPGLGGKTPREAAGDPQLRIPLMAAVLILEQGSNTDRDAETIAELRANSSLPQPEPIEPGGQRVERPAAGARSAAEDRCRFRRRPGAALSPCDHGRRRGGHRSRWRKKPCGVRRSPSAFRPPMRISG